MSQLIPFFLGLDDDDLYPTRHRYQHPVSRFGFGFHPNELREILAIPAELRQLQRQRHQEGNYDLAPTVGKEGFQVCMDVQQFSPNEITVKTVDDFVVVEAKHEERQDEHGYISRQFQRRYKLPKGYDAKSVISSLSSDGVLTVKAPPPQQIESSERIINIAQTGPARLNVKQNEAVTDKEKENVANNGK